MRVSKFIQPTMAFGERKSRKGFHCQCLFCAAHTGTETVSSPLLSRLIEHTRISLNFPFEMHQPALFYRFGPFVDRPPAPRTLPPADAWKGSTENRKKQRKSCRQTQT
mmetsp:Transcript_46433/g.91630  ORF Transcript_46433/g.91630 Transcript_46433/m.91630 type:complete len:108 (+) Transcript_46433:3678-4001(+)